MLSLISQIFVVAISFHLLSVNVDTVESVKTLSDASAEFFVRHPSDEAFEHLPDGVEIVRGDLPRCISECQLSQVFRQAQAALSCQSLYLLFFLVCLVAAAKRSCQGGNRLYCRMGIILCVICMVLTVYNSALRAEGAYILYFALALPFLQGAGERKDGML